MATTFEIQQAAPLLAYLLRAMVNRIDREALPAQRRRDLEEEVTNALLPLALSTRTTHQFVRDFAARFGVNLPGGTFTRPGGGEGTARPCYLLLPRAYVAHLDAPEMAHEKAGPDLACYRWDLAANAIAFDALQMLVYESPARWATFAFAPPDPSDASFCPIPDPAARDLPRFVLKTGGVTLSPEAYRTVWTLRSPLAHGGDQTKSNVSFFRREPRIDPTTGETHFVPIFTGNAQRGILRDLAAGRLCQDIGVDSTELPPAVAHALFAGGTIEAGADGAAVDLVLRRKLRALPFWDAFAGVFRQQIMQGVLRVHDTILVCRENAWMLHGDLAPTHDDGRPMTLVEFRDRLPSCRDLTHLRFGTKHAHRDFEQKEGMQMIWNTEVVVRGAQFLASFQLLDLAGVSSLTASFMAAVLEDFRAVAAAGAGTSRGLGQIAFDPYHAAAGAPPLPSPEAYRAWVRENAAAVRDFLRAGGKEGEEPKARRRPGRGAEGSAA